MKKAEPDIIVISGDLINGCGEKELPFAFHLINHLKKTGIPVIYTFGNHEEKQRKYHRACYRKLRRFAGKRVILLNNRAFKPETINDTVFVGINLPLYMYHATDKSGMIKRRTGKILDEAKAGDCYKILIAHDPEHIEAYAESGFDLCISGHLHGGIIYVPCIGGFVTPRLQFFKKLAKGVHESGNMKMIVSTGVGWHDIPLRLFNHPEVVTIEFKKLKGN